MLPWFPHDNAALASSIPHLGSQDSPLCMSLIRPIPCTGTTCLASHSVSPLPAHTESRESRCTPFNILQQLVQYLSFTQKILVPLSVTPICSQMSPSSTEWAWEDCPAVRRPFPQRSKEVDSLFVTLKVPRDDLNRLDVKDLRLAAEKRVQQEVSPPFLVPYLLLS